MLLVVVALGGAVLVWRRMEAERLGREMWQEVTDPMPVREA